MKEFRLWTGVGAVVHWRALLASILFIVVLPISNADYDGEGLVTCGSIVKIRHNGTGVNLRSVERIKSVHSFYTVS